MGRASGGAGADREGKSATTRTTCPYCGVGCGVLATPRADGAADVAGDPDHPANFGRLCSKGAALGETLALSDRLLHPMIAGQHAGWDAALDQVATAFGDAIETHGPDSVAFYVSGQLLTEDYYVANKLMKGFIGSANIDTNSRLCMASSVAGHKRAFGADTVPGTYEDLELADLVVLVGSNLAWCHPVLYQRLAAARETRGLKVVVIDPRSTATCDIADMHLAIEPGADVALFNGLLVHLVGANAARSEYIAAHTMGFNAAFAAARQMGFTALARTTGLSQRQLFEFFDLFAATEKVVTVYSQGVNQASTGTDKVNAIINCHLATGRIGRPGMGPFSITGQPNAMGGRETGGLANMLAAHMDLDNPHHRRLVQGYWEAPRLPTQPGLKAVDMFQAVADGRIKAIWIMATNPVDSMPDADAVRAALATCPFVVVSDVSRHTDTTALAHVLLPSAAWGEKSGTVTNSERRISRQRPFLALPGEVKPDWWQLAEVAKRMGFGAAFDWAGPHAIFAEYAALTGLGNVGQRDLDIGAYAGISRTGYDTLAPFQWPQAAGSPATETRFFADGGYFTPDRKARFIATPWRKPASQTSAAFPLALNTGRVRDQWHTMTRTAKTPRLMSHIAEPFVEIHPEDARAAGLDDARLAKVTSARGSVIVRTVITARQRRGALFVPMHWTDQVASAARVDALVAPHVDPVSGQPELKFTPARIEPYAAAWYGFAVARVKPLQIGADYWALAPTKAGWRMELAGLELPADWSAFARSLAGADASGEASCTGNDCVSYHDAPGGQHRVAVIVDGVLIAALFVARDPVAVARGWVCEQLEQPEGTLEPLRLLAGRPAGQTRDRGAIVCACFDIGINQIADVALSGLSVTVADVGMATSAGTNCGSCRPEIARIIARCPVRDAG